MNDQEKLLAILATGQAIANLGYYKHRLYDAISHLPDDDLTALHRIIIGIKETYDRGQ